MTERQQETLSRLLLRVSAACASMVLWAASVWTLEQLTGSSQEGAVRIGLLFLAIFGGSSVIRLIGDLWLTARRTSRPPLEEEGTDDEPTH